MRDLNDVKLCGRLTRDPEVRTSANGGVTVARFSLACGRGNDKNGEDKGTDFPNIVAFGKTAEICEKYLAKGKQVIVSGRLQTGSYEGKDGKKVYTTDVIVNELQMVGSKGSGEGQNTQSSNRQAVQDDDYIPF